MDLKNKIPPCVVFLFLALICFSPAYGEDENDKLIDLMRIVEKNPVEEYPLEKIYMKNDILYCTGNSKAAMENNRAADLIEQGKFDEAIGIIGASLRHEALFFPFRYNLGMCYIHINDLKKGFLNFQKAQYIVPEYSRTYLQIGYIYQKWDRDSEAIEYFREALKRNTKELETFVLIGDVFFKRNQLEMAQKYYDTVLRIDLRYPDALLGRAKIYFRRGSYHKAMVMIKSIDISRSYDKTYHYYFAELSFKMRDYKTAADQYSTLLNFRNDKFFLTNSPALIKHKLELSRRLSER